jgi:hypothetical protein
MATDMGDLVSEYRDIIEDAITRILREQNEQIEEDLLCIMGWRADLPKWLIRRLGYEVVWQQHNPESLLEDYRGIRRRGRWLLDWHPDWPFEADEREQR